MNRSISQTVTGVGGALLLGAAALLAPAGAASAGTGTASRPVPKGFKVNSVTWLTKDQGWVLGAAPCGSKSKLCTDVIGTTDGGATWSLLGGVKAPIPKVSLGEPGVTEIRFATPEDGWVFGPGLFHSTNGGRSWSAERIPGHAKQVRALAVNSGAAYTVASTCDVGVVCKASPSLWTTSSLTGSSWKAVALKLRSSPIVTVTVYGQTVYVLNGRTDTGGNKLWASTDGGSHFSSRPVPCDSTEDNSLISVAASSATDVALLCEGAAAASDAGKAVYRSDNTGKTYTYAGALGLPGIQAQLAMSPSGNLAVAATSTGSFMYINDNHKTAWTLAIADSDGGAGWNDLVYTTDSEAFVVYSPADGFVDTAELYITHDGGRHWSVVTL